MREEYDIMNLNPRKNPYAKTNKKQVTINLDEKVIAYLRISRMRSVFRIRRLLTCTYVIA